MLVNSAVAVAQSDIQTSQMREAPRLAFPLIMSVPVAPTPDSRVIRGPGLKPHRLRGAGRRAQRPRPGLASLPVPWILASYSRTFHARNPREILERSLGGKKILGRNEGTSWEGVTRLTVEVSQDRRELREK